MSEEDLMPFCLDPGLNGQPWGRPADLAAEGGTGAASPTPAIPGAAGGTAALAKAAGHHYTEQELNCLREHGYVIDEHGKAVPADGSEATPQHVAAAVARAGQPRPPRHDGRPAGHYGDGSHRHSGGDARKVLPSPPAGPLARALAGRVGAVAELGRTGPSTPSTARERR